MMQSNKGTYITINTLIDLVKYENIIIFGSDDIMHPNMVERISKYLNGYDILKFQFWFQDSLYKENQLEKQLD